MNICHYQEIEASEKSPGVQLRTVIGADQGAPNFVMRVIELAPGVSPRYHSHPWEHEVFVLSGKGRVRSESGYTEIGEGSVIFIGPDEPHGFSNIGDRPLRFICLIPLMDGP